MAGLFQGYLSQLRKIDRSCALSSAIRESQTITLVEGLSEQIREAFKSKSQGFEDSAYASICKALEMASVCDRLISVPVTSHELGPLFRVQKLNCHETPSKLRLFHAPWQYRDKVRSHRFGIASKPCLYLGGSLEVCQSESDLSSSDLAETAVVRLELHQQLTVLDMGYRPNAIAQIAGGRQLCNASPNPDLDRLVVDYARCWPLIAACTMKRSSANCSQPTEYVIPQLLLRWLQEKGKCDGVRYFSSRVCPTSQCLKASMNIVFTVPIQDTARDSDGYSKKLRRAFKMTEPRFWRQTRANAVADEVGEREALFEELMGRVPSQF